MRDINKLDKNDQEINAFHSQLQGDNLICGLNAVTS